MALIGWILLNLCVIFIALLSPTNIVFIESVICSSENLMPSILVILEFETHYLNSNIASFFKRQSVVVDSIWGNSVIPPQGPRRTRSRIWTRPGPSRPGIQIRNFGSSLSRLRSKSTDLTDHLSASGWILLRIAMMIEF